MNKEEMITILDKYLQEALIEIANEDGLDFYVAEDSSLFMARSVVNTLIALKELNEYLEKEGIIKR